MVSLPSSPLCAAQAWTRALFCWSYSPALSCKWDAQSWPTAFIRAPDLVWFVFFFPFTDKTCQWHFQYDCAQAEKTVSKLWEGEGALRQVLRAVVWVWPGGVCGAPHLPDVSLPAWTYKLLPQAHVTEGLHHCTARYFCRQRKCAPSSCLPENYSPWLLVPLVCPAEEVSFRVI